MSDRSLRIREPRDPAAVDGMNSSIMRYTLWDSLRAISVACRLRGLRALPSELRFEIRWHNFQLAFRAVWLACRWFDAARFKVRRKRKEDRS